MTPCLRSCPRKPQNALFLKLSLGVPRLSTPGPGRRPGKAVLRASGAQRTQPAGSSSWGKASCSAWRRGRSFFNSLLCFCHSPILSSALGTLLGKWDLPVFTLPFNIAVTLYLAATGHYNLFFPTTLLQPAASVPNITWSEVQVPLVGVGGGRGAVSVHARR